MNENLSSAPITVVVTVRNEAETILALLEGLKAQTLTPQAVIIVDGGSSDATVETIHSFIDQHPDFSLKLLQLPSNISTGRNAGVVRALTPWIAFTDAGCVPAPDWLAELWQTAQTHPEAKVVAGFYRGAPRNAFEAAQVPFVLVSPTHFDPQHFLPASRSMLIEKNTFLAAGGFDENLSVSEDYALARRLRNQLPKGAMIATAAAVVTWQPRATLRQFTVMIYRMAKWDVVGRNWRPKVLSIFGRYLLIGALATWQPFAGLVALMGYLSYAWLKHAGSLPVHAQVWTPALQVCSDVAVMVGSLHGACHLLLRHPRLK